MARTKWRTSNLGQLAGAPLPAMAALAPWTRTSGDCGDGHLEEIAATTKLHHKVHATVHHDALIERHDVWMRHGSEDVGLLLHLEGVGA